MKIIRDFINLDQDLPRYVYKYRTWQDENNKKVLKKHELFLASPCQFDDPMDCNLEEQLPKGDKLFKFFVEDCLKKNPEKGFEEIVEYANYWCVHSPMANEEKIKVLMQETKNLHDKIFGVLSLTLRYDNDYMWENYGNNFQGYCMGFDTTMLIKTELFGTGGTVRYDKELPLIDFINDDLETKLEKNIFHKKKNPYEKEEEYRLAKTWSHGVSIQERVMTIPIDCVAQIIIGKNAEENVKKEIYDIHRKMYPNVELIQL